MEGAEGDELDPLWQDLDWWVQSCNLVMESADLTGRWVNYSSWVKLPAPNTLLFRLAKI